MAWKNQDITEIGDDEEEITSLVDKYDSSIVYFAFIDVLGFRQYYDDAEKTGLGEKPPYVDVFSYFFDLTSAYFEKADKNLYYAGQTSDTLYFYTTRSDYLMRFIRLYASFSLYAMGKNVFFRGGIAKGDLWRKMKHQFFGKSVINAFYLEENISKNPIVMIDKATAEAIREEQGYSDLIMNENERFFISPFALWNSYSELDIEDTSLIREIDKDKIVSYINDNIDNFEYDDKNRSKYLFLRNRLPEVSGE